MIEDPVAFATGMIVEVTKIDQITVTAQTPGETSGPALRVTIAVRNTSADPQPLDSAVVLLESGADIGIDTTGGNPSPLAGVLAPGDTATGTYVFMLDPTGGREITVSVNYAAGEPVAVFTGTTS